MITTIIIPVLNGYDKLARCVASLPESVDNILIIDNGGALSWRDLRSVPAWQRMRMLQMPSNLGVPQSWNLGIKLYPHEPGWLLLNHDAWFDTESWDAFNADCAPDLLTLAGAPPWCCAWIGREVVNRVGLFCELFYPAYMEDVDYERRCETLGITATMSSAGVRHENSSTIKTDPVLRAANDQTHAQNQRIYAERWARVSQLGVPLEAEWRLDVRMSNSWD